MCGFAGVVSFTPNHRFSPEVMRQLAADLSADLAHRGPDGEGAWSLNCGLDNDTAVEGMQALLVHRRLAVIDPMARSDQPMHSPERRLTIVFNGEIYNFRELRTALPPRDWRTNGDTEVLLAAYETWGEACVDRFEGMFAFAIIDRRNPLQPKVFLARDPAGEKPLYYASQGDDGVAFASELGSLNLILKVVGTEPVINTTAIGHYLAYGYIGGESTVYQAISKIPPSGRVTFSRSAMPLHGSGATELDLEFDDDVVMTRRLVEAAVQKCLVSDVPIGCLLSGGVDSSIVALCMKRALPEVRTFSIGFDDDLRYDESHHAAEVARHLGTTHREFRVSAQSVDLQELLPKLARVFGEPFADSSAIPTSILSQHVREEVTVALGGDGGDELFGGYDRYRALTLTARMRQVIGGKQLAPLAKLLPRGHPKAKVTRARRLLKSLGLDDNARYTSYLRLFSIAELHAIAPHLPDPPPMSLRVNDFGGDLVAAAAALDRATYLPGDLLTKLDRCSMLHSLEMRSPFMDRALLQFSRTLRGRQLIERGRGKALLRKAFAADLPPGVFARRKMGFAVPPAVFVGNAMRELTLDAVLASNGFAASHLDLAAVRQFVAMAAGNPMQHAQKLYAFVMLELWWRQSKA